MSTRGALIGMLLAVSGVVLYLLLGRGGDEPTGMPSGKEAAARPAGGAVARPSGETRPSGSTEPGSTEPARLALRGTVEANGEPVAGAVVTVVMADPDAGADPHTTRSEPDGRFELLALPAARYTISATAAGHLPAVLRSLELRADASITLTLTSGGQPLGGTISDATGGALEGALVRVTPLSGVAALRRLDGFATLSAEDGAYALHVAPGRYRVDVSHPDYAPEHRAVDVGPGAQSQDFALVPMGVIEGIVRHEDGGAPVPGAWVSWQRERLMLLEPGRRTSITTGGGKVRADDAGRFALRGLPPGTILLTARASRAASEGPTAVPLAMAEHAADVEVLVSRAADVRGRVVSKQDPTQGIADASVSVGIRARARTDAEGSFVLEGVLEGRATMYASAEGWLPSFPGTALEVTADAPTELTIELERAPTIRGRVEPPTVAEVSIELRPQTMGKGIAPIMLGGGPTKAESDAEGRFEHARGDLHGACEAPCRCVEDRQALRIDAAVLRDILNDGRRRSLVAFDDERRLRIAVDVAEFFVEFLDARKSARRTGAECEEARRFIRDRPACVLASEAGDDRVIGTDDDTERPIRQTGGLREGDGAESAHADFAETTSGFQRWKLMGDRLVAD